MPPSKWLPNKTDIPEAALQTIVFAFSVGNIDFYVDNLSFYADKCCGRAPRESSTFKEQL